MQQLSCVCPTSLPVLTLQQLRDSTTNSGFLFLPMLTETAVSLPQGFLFFDTNLAQVVCQALADTFVPFCCCCFLVLKPETLKHTPSCKSCRSALCIHRCEDLTFYVTFMIPRESQCCSGAAKDRSSKHDCHGNTVVKLTSQQQPCKTGIALLCYYGPISTRILPAEHQTE